MGVVLFLCKCHESGWILPCFEIMLYTIFKCLNSWINLSYVCYKPNPKGLRANELTIGFCFHIVVILVSKSGQ